MPCQFNFPLSNFQFHFRIPLSIFFASAREDHWFNWSVFWWLAIIPGDHYIISYTAQFTIITIIALPRKSFFRSLQQTPNHGYAKVRQRMDPDWDSIWSNVSGGYLQSAQCIWIFPLYRQLNCSPLQQRYNCVRTLICIDHHFYVTIVLNYVSGHLRIFGGSQYYCDSRWI